jgi:hypothetical protein
VTGGTASIGSGARLVVVDGPLLDDDVEFTTLLGSSTGTVELQSGGLLRVTGTFVADGTLDLSNGGRLEVAGALVLQSTNIVRGAAREHLTVVIGAASIACSGTVTLDDLELADNSSLDLSDNTSCTLVVDDVVASPTSTAVLGSSTITVQGSCSGASFCP